MRREEQRHAAIDTVTGNFGEAGDPVLIRRKQCSVVVPEVFFRARAHSGVDATLCHRLHVLAQVPQLAAFLG